MKVLRSALAIQMTFLAQTTLLGGAGLLANNAFADGLLQGRVSSADGGPGLRGGLVRIEELNIQTSTGRDGFYRLPSVPAGRYTLSVNYLVREPEMRLIQIEDGQILEENFALTNSDLVTEVLVIGQAASVNKALNKQRAADSIMSIVSADAIGQYPDANTSEALQRLPGVTAENDQGEARFVRVRGLGANYNAVSINGVRVPSPESGQRAVALDVVPSELLESLEVTKTLTPDMDADSLGGAINLNGLTAFDREGLFYKASVESHYDGHTGETSPKMAASASNIFDVAGGSRNFGGAVSVSWFDREFGSDNVETGGSWDFDEQARLEEFEQRDYTLSRERFGIALNLDFKPTPNTQIYLRSLFSQYEDSETRLSNAYELYEFELDETGEPVLDDEGDPAVIDGLNSGQSGAASVTREVKERTETLEIASYVLGGDSTFGNWLVHYEAGYSEASEDTPYNVDSAAFEADIDSGVRFVAGDVIRVETPAGALDAANYELDEIEIAETFTEDDETSFKLDFSRQMQLSGNPLLVKFGGKRSVREKTGDEEFWVFEDLDEAGFSEQQLSLSSYTGAPIEYEFGRMGEQIQAASILAAIAPLSRDDFYSPVDSAVADFQMNEDVTAAYLMATLDIGALRILTGVRHEQTDFKARGTAYNEYELDGEEVEELVGQSFANDYSHTLPSLHMRYKITDKTQVRAALTTSLVRPTFEQLSPGKVREGDEVEFGNPDLKALEAGNIDLGIEHFSGFATYYSAYVFYKDIENFIYTIDLGATAPVELVGPGEISEAITYRNGDQAHIYGLELASSWQLSRLPQPWNGLLVAANATWTDSEADIRFLEDDVFQTRSLAMPSQSDFSGNLALGFQNDHLEIRLAANYKSEYLLEISDPASAQGDIWVDSQMSLDLLARWNLNSSLQVYFQALNLGDEPYYAYINQRAFNAQYEEYDPSYRIGISLTRF